MSVQLEESVQTQCEAVYELERAVKCSSCSSTVETLHVVRLMRTKVNFVSSLPRLGYVITCPECASIMSAHVGSRLGF